MTMTTTHSHARARAPCLGSDLDGFVDLEQGAGQKRLCGLWRGLRMMFVFLSVLFYGMNGL